MRLFITALILCLSATAQAQDGAAPAAPAVLVWLADQRLTTVTKTKIVNVTKTETYRAVGESRDRTVSAGLLPTTLVLTDVWTKTEHRLEDAMISGQKLGDILIAFSVSPSAGYAAAYTLSKRLATNRSIEPVGTVEIETWTLVCEQIKTADQIPSVDVAPPPPSVSGKPAGP